MQELYVNARFLSQKITGVQRFAFEVCRHLNKGEHKVVFLCPKKVLHEKLANELNAKRIGKLNGTAWEQLELPSYLKKRNRPHLLNLANTGPISYDNQSLVLHDLAFMKHPEWYSKKFTLWYHFLVPILVKNATNLFTISEFSKREILTIWPETYGIVENIGNGLPALAKSAPGKANRGHDFVICFAGNNERKNARTVINAMQFVKHEDLKLLVLGRPNKSFKGKREDEMNSRQNKNVEIIGEVSDEELSALYQNAKALIYPSFYEGFGLPPLEALSFNCPAVLSDIPVFRETYGGAALYVEAENAEAMAEAIDELVQNTKTREKLLSEGKGILEKYTFKKVSERIVNKLFTETIES